MKVFKTYKGNIIKSWCNNPEAGAIEQAKHLADLPFAFKHIALMPDTHQGYGMPIGGVIATKNVVIPNAVGIDIGCGMLAVKTDIRFEEFTIDTLKNIINDIKRTIPVGFKHHDKPQQEEYIPEIPLSLYGNFEVSRESESILTQIGTLGGGNHFIEIQKGNDGYIWYMLHSGSRNLGYKVAKYYNNIAKELNEKYYTSVPKEHDLAFLPIDTEEGQNYLKEMNYCLDFAMANRQLMSQRIKEAFLNNIDCKFIDEINIHHNYVRLENHYGQNVWVHRKGATSAREGELGIIPGSQGTKSYIVRGKGNKQSFMSCSHGAGRKMGRSEAKKNLNLETEQEKMKGIVHDITSIDKLDEAPSAYKDIDIVMEEQKDLVDIIVELSPLGVIKG